MAQGHVTPLGRRFTLPRDWGQILVMDSASSLTDADKGVFLIAGSHCTAMAARLTLPFEPRAVILNDAGGGKEGCGTAGLAVFDAFAVPAAAVDCFTARIGDGPDMLEQGRLSTLNAQAAKRGLRPGMPVTEAMDLLARALINEPPGARPAALLTVMPGPKGHQICLADTVSLLDTRHRGVIAVVGSHGSDVTGQHLLRIRAAAGFANDAGGGRQDAGFSGLQMLEAQGLPGATYAHTSAMIGDARDGWENGLLSRVNGPAARLGLSPGMPVQAAASVIATALPASPSFQHKGTHS